MKHIRKNKTNQEITWPKTMLFTYKELFELNKDIVPITLRVKLANSVQNGLVEEIGSLPGGKGRPVKVYATTPVTKTVLNKAKSQNINFTDKFDRMVNVVTIAAPVASPLSPLKDNIVIIK